MQALLASRLSCISALLQGDLCALRPILVSAGLTTIAFVPSSSQSTSSAAACSLNALTSAPWLQQPQLQALQISTLSQRAVPAQSLQAPQRRYAATQSAVVAIKQATAQGLAIPSQTPMALYLPRTTPHTPEYSEGPRTVLYPFPIDYYRNREVVVYNMHAEPKGLCTLPGEVYNVPVRIDILHRVVRWTRAMWRQGTKKLKTRAEMRGGGRKPWPQKGTGRARHGSIRSPLWVGGGKALAPRPRSHAHELPFSIQLAGYKCALSAKANEGRLVIVDTLIPDAVEDKDKRMKVKTKYTQQQLRSLLSHVDYETALLVDSGEDALDGGEALRRGARNLDWLTIMPWHKVTVYHMLKYQALVMTHGAAVAMAARLMAPPTDDPLALRRLLWTRHQRVEFHDALQRLQAADQQQGTEQLS